MKSKKTRGRGLFRINAPPALSKLSMFMILAGICFLPDAARADVGNPVCPGEEVFFDPGNGEDIVVPQGYKVEVFAKGLNFPTDVAFMGGKHNFKVAVLESGQGLPSRCNDNTQVPAVGKFDPANPFTPGLLILDKSGNKIAGPLGKPTPSGGGLQPDGPAIGLAFERPGGNGRLFVTSSNQGARGAPGAGNNSSRISVINPGTGAVVPFITGLPTGDHPTEQLAVKGKWIYWSQGSATNSGVAGLDNGGGANQNDIPCQDIRLSDETFDSGGGVVTSGFSPHGVARPGAHVPAFEGATRKGMCTGAILRARVDAHNPASTIEPVSWGYRNPFGIRFAPENHPLKGELLVTENGEDERGARPVNNAPDRLQVARQNKDGTPDFHGWPDRFGFLESTQVVFNPIGGPADDNPGAAVGNPVRPVLAFPPQAVTTPLAALPADVAAVGLDFAPDGFVGGVVKPGAALVSREGDFGFTRANGMPIEGHDIQMVNFSKNAPLQITTSRFAFNCKQADQRHTPDGGADCADPKAAAFVSRLRGINRPITAAFGPDDALYLVDYGAVRDFGQSEPESSFTNPADAALVQIPGTGVIWKISRVNGGRHGN